DGSLSPHHNGRARGLQLSRNEIVELLAARNLGVPPYAPALRFKHGDERRNPRFVDPCIGDEDVGHHFASVPRRASACATAASKRGSSRIESRSVSCLAQMRL